METLFVSTGVVALAEIGDKIQLLTLMLATQLRRPVAIILGILLATLANHATAACLGMAVAAWLASDYFTWLLVARSWLWVCGPSSRTISKQLRFMQEAHSTALSHKLGRPGSEFVLKLGRCASSCLSVTVSRLKSSATQFGSTQGSL